jgi:uncharacterized membrane protein YbaN (DUF454 family)
MSDQPRQPPNALARALLVAAGWASLVLAALGVALPLLPVTPFVLLASACFLRSSPRLHRALLARPRLGPYLRQWQRDRSVPPGAKKRAWLLVVVTFSVSILTVEGLWLRCLLAALGIGVLTFLARLRTGAPHRVEPPREADAEASKSLGARPGGNARA